jgi:hypothetical protein
MALTIVTLSKYSNPLNCFSREHRSKLQANFAKPGNPGAKFKNQSEKLIKCMNLPKAARDELGIGEDGVMPGFSEQSSHHKEAHNDEEEEADQQNRLESERRRKDQRMLRELYGEGKYYLIPSFFRTLMYLKKQKKEFAISFRTFGNELDTVIHEFNSFCNGEHPCFNGRNSTPLVKFDGTKASKDYRIREHAQQATIYRSGEGINETIMVTGKHKRVSKIMDLNYIDGDGDNQVIRDHLDIFQTIIETFKKCGTMAF